MASSRPASMIIPAGVFDETNTNGTKNVLQKKDSQPVRSSNQQKLPVNNLINTHSSSSSIDSTGAKNAILLEKHSLPPMNLTATISSTTTDSDLESEQEERYLDDNHSSESTKLPIQIPKQKFDQCDSGQQKSDVNTQEQLSRRVKHFQKLFKSEMADEMPELIDSYVCAYQGDILLQGKMYITNRYLCFHSRIISYVTKHVYRWEQIENISKERVAFIFPTAIGIQLKSSGKKIIYASFLQRDQAYDKILSICSRFSNDSSSVQDEEENHLTIHGETFKSIHNNHRHYHEKNKKSKRNRNFDIPDEPEQDDVLQMCLGQEKRMNTKRQIHSGSSKTSEEKQQSNKLINSDNKKSLILTNSNHEQILSNENRLENNEPSRNSRISKHQDKDIDTTLANTSVLYRPSHNSTSRTRQNLSRDRTSSPPTSTLSNLSHSNSTSNLMTNLDSSIRNSNTDGLIKQYFRMVILSVISVIKILTEYLFLFYHQFQTYPIKTSLILLIFVVLLIIHSFYLIKLAYRIENRLQSLHHTWLSSSSMKNSLPSLKEL